jgi:hypothetical protein
MATGYGQAAITQYTEEPVSFGQVQCEVEVAYTTLNACVFVTAWAVVYY